MARTSRNPMAAGQKAAETPLPSSPSAAIAPGGILHDEFRGASWDRWRTVLKAAWGEPLSPEEVTAFREVAGGRNPPPGRVKELWVIVGRRGGKDSIASAIAAVIAMQDFSPYLRAGELATIACLASDRDQASIVRRYIGAYFQDIPRLKTLIKTESDDVLELTNRCEIRITTNNKRAVRGRALACAILDEVAYWQVARDAASSDQDVYDAIEPGTASIPGAIIVGISTPDHKRGLLYEKWAASFGRDDPDILVIQAPSRTFNPKLRKEIVDKRLAADEIAGAAEYLAQWRPGVSDFLPRDLIASAVDEGVAVRAPREGVSYSGFVDGAAGTGESSFCAAVAHGEDGRLILDAVMEVQPPFNPATVVDEVATFLRSYRIGVVTGDNHARPWLTDGFGKSGIRYEKSALDKSALFSNVLPHFTSGSVRLLDNPRLTHQFASLERTSTAAGKETVKAGGRSQDDAANAVAGALLLVRRDDAAVVKQSSVVDLLTPHPTWARHIYSVMLFAADGTVAQVIFAEHDFVRGPNAPCILIDAYAGPLVEGSIGAAVERLRVARMTIPTLRGRTLLHVPQSQLQLAWSEGFTERDAGEFAGVHPIPKETGRDFPAMAIEFASHALSGRFKVSETLWTAKAADLPLAGALQMRPGEKIEENTLKMAVLIGAEMAFPRR